MPTVQLSTDAPTADTVIVPVSSSSRDALRALWAEKPALLRALEDLGEKAGSSVTSYPDEAPRTVLVSAGEGKELDEVRLAFAKAPDHKESELALDLRKRSSESFELDELVSAAVEGALLGRYRFADYKTDEEARALPDLTVHMSGATERVERAARRAAIRAEAVCTARDLVNRSPHDKTATLLARSIEEIGADAGFEVDIWGREQIEEEGMGGLLAVNRGSVQEPSFTVMEHAPEEALNEQPIVLVGKGVVFDTGGLSLKSTKGSMDMMKADMAGAAAVIGAFEAIARMELPLHVIGLIPATDNRPGKDAYVPGDVVRMHSGATVEVLNTDAEGRMLLADALSYAQRYDPALVVDFATLTGAAVVALGTEVAAVMTPDKEEAARHTKEWVKAGQLSGDRVHPLPLWASYRKQLDSDVADLKNVGGREAGSITAGKFLEHFTAYPWVHVDIAGPAFRTSPSGYHPSGGSGFGVRLITTYLEHVVNRGGIA